MKRNIFVLFVIAMIAICISSCSNSFDVADTKKLGDGVGRSSTVTEVKLVYGENWENPETGEYFRWLEPTISRGSIAHNFEFDIQFNTNFNSFYASTDTVDIQSTGQVVNIIDPYDPVSQYDNLAYAVEIVSTDYNFNASGYEQTLYNRYVGTGYKSIRVRIPGVPLDGVYHLQGSGSVINND